MSWEKEITEKIQQLVDDAVAREVKRMRIVMDSKTAVCAQYRKENEMLQKVNANLLDAINELRKGN